MNCPNCGVPNNTGMRFCGNCGKEMPAEVVPPPTYPAAPPPTYPAAPPPTYPAPPPTYPTAPPPTYSIPPTNPITSPAQLSGLAGLVGGVMVVIGWLMPWFGIGLGYAGTSGLGSLLGGFSAGAGSGLQLALTTLLGALASFGLGASSGYGGGAALGSVIGIIALSLFALLVAIPIIGVLNIRTGNSAYALRNSTGNSDRMILSGLQQQIRSRSITGLILLVVIFALVSLVPFLNNALGGGFFVTAFGFGICFLGIFFSK